MNAIECDELARLEETIAAGLKSWFHAGMALREIRDRRLYKETHSRFDAYALERWGLNKSSLYQRLWACEVVVELGCPEDTTEFALNTLYHLGDDKKRVWDQCLERANGGPVTVPIIRSVCSKIKVRCPARINIAFRWPSWLNAQFIAMDEEGRWSAFSSKPSPRPNLGCWKTDGDKMDLVPSLVSFRPPKCDDWLQSLMARPEIHDEPLFSEAAA